jgi:hypothetical protein
MRIYLLAEEHWGPMIEYGILTEESTHRVHICAHIRKIYTFKTEDCKKLINDGNYEQAYGWTNILEEKDPSFCEIHGVKMSLHKKNGREWYSHWHEVGLYVKGWKGWCYGKCSIITAIGYKIPPLEIPGCQEVLIPPQIWQKNNIKQYDKLTVKGSKAHSLCYAMLGNGSLPLSMDISNVVMDSSNWQIRGVDITMHSKINIQVKCDYFGGDSNLGGTGHLYIQTHERNPFDIH